MFSFTTFSKRPYFWCPFAHFLPFALYTGIDCGRNASLSPVLQMKLPKVLPRVLHSGRTELRLEYPPVFNQASKTDESEPQQELPLNLAQLTLMLASRGP